MLLRLFAEGKVGLLFFFRPTDRIYASHVRSRFHECFKPRTMPNDRYTSRFRHRLLTQR